MTIYLIISLFFLAVLSGLMTFYLWYAYVRSSPRYELQRRLRTLAMSGGEALPSDVVSEILTEMTPLDKTLYKFRIIRKIDRLIDNSGLKIDYKVFMLAVLISAFALFSLGIMLQRGMIIAAVFLPVGAALPFLFLKITTDKRSSKFTEQFPGALDMMSRSLKAGHSLSSAIQMIGMEMSDPIGGLFKHAYEEHSLGLSVRDSMDRMLDRMSSMDLRLFVASLAIHREVGGNLSEMLENLAQTIRERLKIRRQVRVYTAQGRLTGYILAVLPVAMAVILYFIAQDYLMELVSIKQGKILIAAALGAQILGFLIIKRLINIRI